MKKVFLIHGYRGEPNGGARPWIMGKLSKDGIWACAPAMPMADGPKKDEWVMEIKRQVGEPTTEIFLVGHSLGVPAILHYLETLSVEESIGGVVLISGPIHILEADKYRPIDHFMDTEFNFEHIKKVCQNFVVIHGELDPAVPFAHSIELSNNLSCENVTIKGGDHLSDYYELPEAYDALMKMINK